MTETTLERLWEIRRTDRAVLFCTTDDGTGRQIWIPRSTIKHISREAPLPNGWRPCNVTMELWIAQKHGL